MGFKNKEKIKLCVFIAKMCIALQNCIFRCNIGLEIEKHSSPLTYSPFLDISVCRILHSTKRRIRNIPNSIPLPSVTLLFRSQRRTLLPLTFQSPLLHVKILVFGLQFLLLYWTLLYDQSLSYKVELWELDWDLFLLHFWFQRLTSLDIVNFYL